MELEIGELYHLSTKEDSDNVYLYCIKVMDKIRKHVMPLKDEDGINLVCKFSRHTGNKIGLCLGVDYFFTYFEDVDKKITSSSFNCVLFLIDGQLVGVPFSIVRKYFNIEKAS